MFDERYYQGKQAMLTERLNQKKNKLIRVMLEEMRAYVQDDQEIGQDIKEIQQMMIIEHQKQEGDASKPLPVKEEGDVI